MTQVIIQITTWLVMSQHDTSARNVTYLHPYLKTFDLHRYCSGVWTVYDKVSVALLVSIRPTMYWKLEDWCKDIWWLWHLVALKTNSQGDSGLHALCTKRVKFIVLLNLVCIGHSPGIKKWYAWKVCPTKCLARAIPVGLFSHFLGSLLEMVCVWPNT